MNKICLIAAIIMTLVIQSCSSGDDLADNDGKNPPNVENQILEGTKWTTRSFDFDVADDLSWAYMFTDITTVYFYSNSEGAFYYSRKTDDSDAGHSRDTQVCFFTYKVDRSNSVVWLDPLTYKCTGFSPTLTLKGDDILYGNEPLLKGKISDSDKSWLNEISGTTGSCKWFYDMKHTLSIVGNGNMGDYTSYDKTPWAIRDAEYNDIYIGEGVTGIGACAFACPSLGAVEIYNSKIISIGKGAFKNSCIGAIDIPSSVTIIGDDAFAGCKYLKTSLYGDIEEIGSFAFSDCKSVSLTGVKKLRSIGDGAFSGSSVPSFNSVESLETIGHGAISLDDKKVSIELPAIKSLGSMAVVGKKLGKIHIGNSLAHVEGTPFSGAATGEFYINQSQPLDLSDNIIENPQKWTLYVPKGSESRYKQAPYWKNFKSITGSDQLEGDGSGDDNNPDDGSGDEILSALSVSPRAYTVAVTGTITAEAYNKYKSFDLIYSTSRNFTDYDAINDLSYPDFSATIKNLEPEKNYYFRIRCLTVSSSSFEYGEINSFETTSPKLPSYCSYTIDGKRFEMVKVTGLSTGDFYIMQTELPPISNFAIDGNSIVLLDENDDDVIIQAEFREFLRDIRNKTDIPFRLPTKAEWVYAAMGGQSSRGYKYSGSDNLDEVGWYKNNSSGTTHTPASLKPNELGLYDMSGNYSELVRNPASHEMNVDGNLYGGWYNSDASKCTPQSYGTQPTDGKIPGTTKSNKNAVECRHSTVRLVYSAQ